jgi:hypothetical protein
LADYLILGVISRIYRRDLVDEVIAETRRKEQRNRLLPARLVVYYVIALALFFGEAYEEVMRKMVGGLRFVSAWERAWRVPTPSALCQARQRLGEAPLRRLFEQAAAPLATPATIGAWLGRWRLMAVNGVTLDVPDTGDNEAVFGRPSSRRPQGGAFPPVRLIGLGECGTHAVVAELGPLAAGEGLVLGVGVLAPAPRRADGRRGGRTETAHHAEPGTPLHLLQPQLSTRDHRLLAREGFTRIEDITATPARTTPRGRAPGFIVGRAPFARRGPWPRRPVRPRRAPGPSGCTGRRASARP